MMDITPSSPRFTLRHGHTKPRASAPDDNPETLAKCAIGLLEDHLRERYGILVPMGIELEFVSQYPERFKNHQGINDPLGYPDGCGRLNLQQRYEPAYRKSCPTVRLFKNSPSIAYLYKEDDYLTDKGLHQYEIVFSHQGAYGPAKAHRLHNLAAAVMLKRKQFTGERPRCLSAGQLMKPENLRYSFPNNYFPEASFSPFITGFKDERASYITNGMHVNFSLIDHATGHPITWIEDGEIYSALDSHITDAHWKLMEEVLWLIAPEPENYPRLAKHGARLASLSESRDYFENPLAAANCNPYYAVLINLAAIALALSGKTAEEVRTIGDTPFILQKDRPLSKKEWLPTNPSETHDRFARETLLSNLLNELEPELGNRFHNAILKTPPGQEPGAYRTATSTPPSISSSAHR